jgi:hypothetical protein
VKRGIERNITGIVFAIVGRKSPLGQGTSLAVILKAVVAKIINGKNMANGERDCIVFGTAFFPVATTKNK